MNKKGQYAIEFIIVIAFSLLFLAVFLVYFQSELRDTALDRDRASAQQVYNLVLNEITMAEQSPAIYERTFYLPTSVQGIPYEANIYDGQDLVIDLNDNQFVYFLPRRIDEGYENFGVGQNTIVKTCPSGSNCHYNITG